jgi:hypothetical protein
MPHATRLALTLALSVPAALGAQAGAQPAAPDSAPVGVRAGETVRLQARSRDAEGRRIDCDARVSALVADTLVLENVGRWSPCPRRAYAPDDVASLRVMRGHRGSRLMHAGVGLLIGAAVGGVTGYALAGGSCEAGCGSDGDIEAVILTFLGITGGGATGLLVGALLPAGPQWVTVPAGTPVRVAGLELRPAVRVGLARR